MIYRTLTCDLIGVDVYMECHDWASFRSAIRSVSPFADSGGFLWNGTQVSGTERLSKLVEAHFAAPDQRDDKLNPAFIDALEQIFAENGVPWSDKPLLPIMPNAAGTATRPDGDVVKFNPNTNEFGILSGDGNVRTYLRLDERSHDYPSNLDYFYAQKGRNR